MSYLVLARKYRPLGFNALQGQEHVRRTLQNSIKRGKASHALVLTGPRGVGKTTISRVFAKALNCQGKDFQETIEPCMKCEPCIAITKGTSLAVREIDGASHNSVDDVRDLIESFRTMPPAGYKAKVYIIDEVHMLSPSAFNALLKSLEEPPPNTYFVLATTEVQKIPDTVLSRCQRHDLRALDSEMIYEKLLHIAKEENLEFDEDALRIVTRYADGSMRDAETLFDRVQAYCVDKITTASVTELLGLAGKDAIINLTDAILSKNEVQSLKLLNEILSNGRDVSILMKEFIEHLRELTYASVGGVAALKILGISQELSVRLVRQANSESKETLLKMYDEARTSCDIAIRSSYPRYGFEAIVTRLALGESEIILQNKNIEVLSVKNNIDIKKSEPIILEQPNLQQSNQTLNFTEFLSYTSSVGAKFIQESLKRLSVTHFKVNASGLGFLEGDGPQFLISSLQQKTTVDKLKSLLADFTKTTPANWSLKFSAIQEKVLAAPGSIAYSEEEARKKKHDAREAELLVHPKFLELQSVLSGAKVDKISLKD